MSLSVRGKHSASFNALRAAFCAVALVLVALSGWMSEQPGSRAEPACKSSQQDASLARGGTSGSSLDAVAVPAEALSQDEFDCKKQLVRFVLADEFDPTTIAPLPVDEVPVSPRRLVALPSRAPPRA